MPKSISTNTTSLVQLLNIQQAAAVLGIGKRTLQEQVAARKIPVIKIGSRVLFEESDLRAFIEASKTKAIS